MSISEQYNSIHNDYSQMLDKANKLSNGIFHKLFKDSLSGKKVLDIGCGDGSDLKTFHSKGALVYGLDPSQEFLTKAKHNNPSGVFALGVGEQIPFEDNFFDIVVSKWAIQTSPNVNKVLSEAARVLKKNGKLVILTKHPIMQWLEKVRDYGHGADYYRQMLVTSNIYSNSIKLTEPSHTLNEYLNVEFLSNFELTRFEEFTDFPASEQLNNDIYPTFFIIEANKK